MVDDVKADTYFCSDTLYLPSIYRDLFIEHNNLSRWHFNPAPNFFPDMLAYFVLMFITNNFIIASFVFSLIQYLFIGFLFVRIFKLVFPNGNSFYTLVIYSLLSFFLLEFFFFTKEFLFVFYFLVNSYHTGAFVMTLICVIFSFKYIQTNKWKWLALIFIAGFLTVISDRLFVALFTLPMLAAVVCFFRKFGIKKTLILAGVIILQTVVGLYVFKMIDSYPYPMETQPAKADVMLSQFGVFLEQMKMYLTEFGIQALALYLFILSLFFMGYMLIRSLRRSENILVSFYSLWSLAFSFIVISAPILSGRFQGPDCLRYSIYPFYLGVLNIAVFLAYILSSSEIPGGIRLPVITFNLLLLITGISLFSPSGIKNFFTYYPEIAQKVDALAEKEDLLCGVGNYWEAKKITMFSKKGVKVYAVFDDISFYPHVANEYWFFNNMFNFAIVNNLNDTTIYKDKLEDIRFIKNTPTFKVIKTRPFTYYLPSGNKAVSVDINEK